MSNGLKSLALRLYGVWLLADFIVIMLSLLWVAITREIVDVLVELLMNAAIGSIPFPFNFIASWNINPIPGIIQAVLFFLLIGIFFYKDPDFLNF